MPVNIVANNAGLSFGGSFKTALNNFFNQLSALNFAVRGQLQTGANVKYPVVSISAAGVFAIPGNTLGGIGNNVHLTYMPSGFGFRGTFPVASNDGNNVTFIGITPPGVAVPVRKATRAQLAGYGFTIISVNSALVSGGYLINAGLRVSKHNVGRPANQPIGRRKRAKT